MRRNQQAPDTPSALRAWPGRAKEVTSHATTVAAPQNKRLEYQEVIRGGAPKP